MAVTEITDTTSSGVVILQYDGPKILVRTRHFNVSGSGNLLVMEVQT